MVAVATVATRTLGCTLSDGILLAECVCLCVCVRRASAIHTLCARVVNPFRRTLVLARLGARVFSVCANAKLRAILVQNCCLGACCHLATRHTRGPLRCSPDMKQQPRCRDSDIHCQSAVQSSRCISHAKCDRNSALLVRALVTWRVGHWVTVTSKPTARSGQNFGTRPYEHHVFDRAVER